MLMPRMDLGSLSSALSVARFMSDTIAARSSSSDVV